MLGFTRHVNGVERLLQGEIHHVDFGGSLDFMAIRDGVFERHGLRRPIHRNGDVELAAMLVAFDLNHPANDVRAGSEYLEEKPNMIYRILEIALEQFRGT